MWGWREPRPSGVGNVSRADPQNLSHDVAEKAGSPQGRSWRGSGLSEPPGPDPVPEPPAK